MSDVKVEATVLDPPELMSGADRWLAEVRGRVEARRGEYMPREISSMEDYRQSKRERTALRKDIAEVDGERKAMTREIKDAVRRFELGCKDVLAPLTEAEAEYKAEIDAYEKRLVDARKVEMARPYAEMAPDLVPLVPFERLCDKFAAEGKWFSFSTGDVKAIELMEGAVETVAADEGAISAAVESEEEEREVKAEYFQTLDLSQALRNCLARREQRRRVDDLERQRAEYARQTAQDGQERTIEPEPVYEPEKDIERPQKPSERILVFEVTVPESKVREFREAMIAIGGVHGRKVGERHE